jgi:hypothetical protein
VCTVAVLYEDEATRDLAIQLCHGLADQFEKELDFEFTWWKFKYLSDAEIAAQAAQAAGKADLILVSVHHTENFPLEVMAWFERWLSTRTPSEGALVLLQTPADRRSQSDQQDSYLRFMAQRAHLDYLPLFEPDSLPASSDRLREDMIVSEPARSDQTAGQHSSGWGIND